MATPVVHRVSEPAYQQGWQARLKIKLQKIANRTCMLPQYRVGPLTVQRPFYPEGEVCHVYVLHPPGGVVGGDRLSLRIDAVAGAHGLMTTPGAAKFYRSAQQQACLSQEFNVEQGAVLEILPQENIYYPAAEVHSDIVINLQENSKYAGWEIHCFGLPANCEDFTGGTVLLNTELNINGKRLLHDRLKIDAIECHRMSGLRGHRVYGSFVIYSTLINSDLLQTLQSFQAESGITGVSCVEPALLVVRYLGDSTAHAHAYFRQLWQLIRPIALGCEACPPRIWNT